MQRGWTQTVSSHQGREKKTQHERKEEAAQIYPHNEALGLSCLLRICLSRGEGERERARETRLLSTIKVQRDREP